MKRELEANSSSTETTQKKIKQHQDQEVIIILDDSDDHLKLMGNYLKNKMERISRSTVKYHSEKKRDSYDFIPIEYYHDGEFVLDLFTDKHRKGEAIPLFDRDVKFRYCPLLVENIKFLDKLIEVNGSFVNRAPKDYVLDKEKLKKALKTYPGLYMSLSEWKEDKEVVSIVVEKIPNLSFLAPKCLRTDKELFLKAIQHKDYNGSELALASLEIRADREIALVHVTKFPKSIVHASQELQSDRDFILQCVKINGMVIEFIQKFQFDREIVLESVKYRVDPDLTVFPFNFVPKTLQRDREVVLTSVSNSGLSLKLVPTDFRADREIVLAAVRNNGRALEFAYTNLKNDREIVVEAIKQCADSIRFASTELRKDRDIVLQAIKQDGNLLFFTPHFENDRELVLEAIEHGGSLEYASSELQEDLEIVLKAVSFSTSNLDYASEEIRSDKQIVLDTIILESKKQEAPYIQPFIYATEELQNDKDFVIQVVQIDASSLQFASTELQNDIEVIRNARVGRITEAEMYSKELILNREFVKHIAKQNFKLVIDFYLEKDKEYAAIGLEYFGFFNDYSKEAHFRRLAIAYPELEHVEKYYQLRY